MATTLQDLIVRVIAKTEGEDRLQALDKMLQDMGIDAEKAAPMAAKLAAEIDVLNEKQSRAGKSGLDLVNSLKLLAGSLIVREFVQANASMESMSKALELVTGSSTAAGREMDFVRQESARLGLENTSAANSYTLLAAAARGTAMEGAATREIWSAVTEAMARLGKSTVDTDGALLAVQQMMSKGVVSAEELRGQLGERLPGAFQAAARAMNVSTQELSKMLEQGKIVASDFLPRFAEELRRIGGAGGDIETFNARLARLWSSLKEGALALNDTVPIFDGLSWATGKAGATIGLMTSYLAIAKAGLTGNQEAVEKYAARIDSAGRALFGMGQQASATGADLAGMASQAEGASRSLASQIGDALVSAMVRLRGEVKTTDDALKNLGVDPEKIRTGVSAAERVIIESFKRLAADPAIDGQVLLGSLLMALDQVGKEAIPEIAFAYKAASRAGRQSADEQIAGLGAIKSALNAVPAGLNQLEAAYKSLGIQSQAALDAQASNLKPPWTPRPPSSRKPMT